MKLHVLEQDKGRRFNIIVARLNQDLLAMKKRNPQGFLDQFDQQVDEIGCQIASELGGRFTYRDDGDHHLIFSFPPATEESVDRYLEGLNHESCNASC